MWHSKEAKLALGASKMTHSLKGRENQHYFLAKSTNFIQEEIILSGGKYVVE